MLTQRAIAEHNIQIALKDLAEGLAAVQHIKPASAKITLLVMAHQAESLLPNISTLADCVEIDALEGLMRR